MFTVRQNLGALALALTAVATAGAIGSTPASAASSGQGVLAAAGTASSPIAIQEWGIQNCGVGVSIAACYPLRADYVRHGYKTSSIEWNPVRQQNTFDYWI